MRPGSARLTVLSVMVVAALAAPAAAQTLYRWVDENGVVHYSQFPPPAPTAPPSPGPEGKPAAPPEAKPSPPGAKPSLPPEAKPAPAGGTKPAPAPEAKPSRPPKPKPSPAASLTPRHEQAVRELVHMATGSDLRSEEHTSELQSPCNLVCRLLLEKKKHTTVPDAVQA